MMSIMITYFCWYLTLLGTGVYLLAYAIAECDRSPKTMAWYFLRKTQLASGLTVMVFPFVHLWMAAHQ